MGYEYFVDIFWVITNWASLRVFRKINIFLGYEDFVDIFWVITNWASLRVISIQFMVFFKGQCTELGYFLGLLKFQIFFFFWGGGGGGGA